MAEYVAIWWELGITGSWQFSRAEVSGAHAERLREQLEKPTSSVVHSVAAVMETVYEAIERPWAAALLNVRVFEKRPDTVAQIDEIERAERPGQSLRVADRYRAREKAPGERSPGASL